MTILLFSVRETGQMLYLPFHPSSLLYDAYTTARNPIHSVMESAVINLDIA